MKKLFSQVEFIFNKRQFILYGLFLIVFIAMWLFVDYTNDAPLDIAKPTQLEDLNWWAKWADPIVGMGTFLLALLIGALQLRDDWEESLPSRLTVIFKHNGRQVMLCKKAHLTAEGDIRQLGQQIGGQMAETRNLKFKANDIESKRLGVDSNEFQNGRFFVHFQVEFELTSLPDKEKFKTHDLIWHEPDNTSIGEKEEWIILDVKEETTEEEIN
jgi:hypothetical protein